MDMFSILVAKELRLMLRSLKFAAAFGLSTLLLLVSVFTGIREYRAAAAHYALGTELSQQTLRSQSSWMGASVNAYRPPAPLQVLAGGITNSIGRFSPISAMEPAKLRHSAYTDEPIFALFGPIDPAFIVVAVFSLMAIVFSFDAINGERESGTLRLTFANALPRRLYVAAKFAGAWLALVIPLVIPVLLATLVLLLSGIPFSGGDWVDYLLFWLLSILVTTFFLSLGLLASSLTRQSSNSFLIALACWVAIVFLLPRIAVLAAGGLRPAPSAAEVDAEQDVYARDLQDQQIRRLEQRWQERSRSTESLPEEEAARLRQEKRQEWMAEDEEDRRGVARVIDQHAVLLDQQRTNALNSQQELATNLARISPASAYLFSAMALAGTDPGLKERTMESFRRYREEMTSYVAARQKQAGSAEGFRVTFDSKAGFSFSAPREKGTLDLTGFPSYEPPAPRSSDASAAAAVNGGILLLSILAAFSGAVAAFHRFDLR
jgi:ABC-type transport system involved in multi-copper enzyme maturation permease subunit